MRGGEHTAGCFFECSETLIQSWVSGVNSVERYLPHPQPLGCSVDIFRILLRPQKAAALDPIDALRYE